MTWLAGRLVTLTKASVTTRYTYDGLGRRIRKVSSTDAASTVLFAYGQDGQLLGEYDANGKALREYVWLGSTPIAIFTSDPANAANPPLAYYIHADHLDTPRIVVDRNGTGRWTWLAEPFGTTAPDTNPKGLGVFTQNLRFPGQYADQESGLIYNANRDYDASIGRYVESDPVGLKGGINTFSYVSGNPTAFTDPEGLACKPIPGGFVCGNDIPPPIAGGVGGAGASGGAGSNYDPTDSSRDRDRDSSQCTVYHLKDCAGDTIYVGITSRDPRSREREHETRPDGKMKIFSCEKCPLRMSVVVKYTDRASCEYAEKQEIKYLRPFANIKENPDSSMVRYQKYQEWWSQRCINCQ